MNDICRLKVFEHNFSESFYRDLIFVNSRDFNKIMTFEAGVIRALPSTTTFPRPPPVAQ